MFNKLKQFKDMRDQAKKMQDMLAGESATVNTMGGQVVMTMDGNLQISGLAIAPEALSPDKKEKLESAIKEAHTEAMKKIQRAIAMKMQQSGDLNLKDLLGGMGGDAK
jgi:DNA-binding protein YbaB